MIEYLGLFPDELKTELEQMGEKAFRAKQVFSWLHKGAAFDEMSNLSLALREKLKSSGVDQPVSIQSIHQSQIDGTKKFLFSLRDGNCVEGVLMRYHYGCTLCVSTQVGCRMGCLFCASTLDGCVRNLSAAEILGQVMCANSTLDGERVHNIVLMGSGEPFDNYENVIRFLKLVSHPDGLNISLRHISLSTCGIVPKIYELMEKNLQLTLSVSLHAPTDEIRSSMMPVNKKWNVDTLLAACREYGEKTKRRISFEYAMIKGKNDTEACALRLAEILKGIMCHVNLIPVNPVKENDYEKTERRELNRFADRLNSLGINTTVRRTLGGDIDASCGQLRRKYTKEHKSC